MIRVWASTPVGQVLMRSQEVTLHSASSILYFSTKEISKLKKCAYSLQQFERAACKLVLQSQSQRSDALCVDWLIDCAGWLSSLSHAGSCAGLIRQLGH